MGMVRRSLGLLLVGVSLAVSAGTGHAVEKRIYIAPDDHTDYMWSADEATYRDKFIQMLDYYLNLADQTQGNLPEYQSRWNTDGSFWVWTYEKNKSPAEFDRLVNRIRTGHITVPLNPLVQALGGTPAEAVLRGMYYAGRLERRYNLRFPIAHSIENQTHPFGLVSLWAGAGAKYSWNGVCNCVTKVAGLGSRDYPIYWWTGLDGSRVLMKWYPLLTTNDSLGGYAEARNPSTAVDVADAYALSPGYPYAIVGAFGKGWDDVSTLTNEFPAVAQSKTTATRKVIVSNEVDFFQDFEATYGAGLPSLGASFGNEWELLTASMAEVSARVRRSVEKLRGAEAMATLVSLRTPSFLAGRETARDRAWMDLGLYWEHDWTGDGPVPKSTRAAWQRRLAGEIEGYVNTLHSDAAAALGGMIAKSGTNVRFYAFNPLSWTRTDYAELPYADTGAARVVDLSTGQETPSQIVTVGGERRLRVQAQSVPPVGYKVFEIRTGAGQSYSPAATAAGSVLENGYYKVTLADRGAITSLIDKTRGNREFAATVGGRALNDLGSGTGTLQIENAGPVSVTLLATGISPLNHTSRITLFRDSARIDIQNEIIQNFGGLFTWGFGFNLPAPDVWHEEVGSVIRAKLLAGGGHYSPRNARYDWLTLNHFADMSGGGVGATLSSSDLSFMKLGSSTSSALDTNTPLLSALAGGQVDGSSYGMTNQDGDARFLQRFALTTHDAYNEAGAMRFALEHQNPFVAGVVTGGSGYPETSYSLLTLSDPNVILWALKPAEDGAAQGVVARFWNFAPAPANATVTFPFALTGVSRTSHIETDQGPVSYTGQSVAVSLSRNQMQTYRFSLSATPPPDTTPPRAPSGLRIF